MTTSAKEEKRGEESTIPIVFLEIGSGFFVLDSNFTLTRTLVKAGIV